MSDPSPSMSDPPPSPTSMDKDEQKGMKRKNDDSDALLPTEETHESTNNQGERQQDDDDDVQMQDVAVAAPNKVDDKAKMEALRQIIENILTDHSDSRFLKNWINRGQVRQEDLLGSVVDACKAFTNKETFQTFLKTIFKRIFENVDFLTVFASAVYAKCVSARLIVESMDFSTRVVGITHGLNQDYLGTYDLQQFQKHINKVLEWHKEGHKTYISPSFAMVQSSGMG